MKEMEKMKGFFYILAILVGIVFFLQSGQPVEAAGPSFTLYPSTGYALLGQDFAVDILLDTGVYDTTMARAVFRFDPTQVRVTKAEHGDLYCQYPDDEYTVDNSLGWVKLTGFCLDPYYNSTGTPGLFGRITFVPLIESNVTFEFVEDYSDSEWESSMTDAGSPPQNISGITYSGGSYTAVSSIDGATPVDGSLPGVGIFDDRRVMIGGALIVSAALVFAGDRVLRSINRRKKLRDDRTVIV